MNCMLSHDLYFLTRYSSCIPKKPVGVPSISILDLSLTSLLTVSSPGAEPAEVRCTQDTLNNIFWCLDFPAWRRSLVGMRWDSSLDLAPACHCPVIFNKVEQCPVLWDPFSGSVCLPKESCLYQEHLAITGDNQIAKGQHKNIINRSQGKMAPPDAVLLEHAMNTLTVLKQKKMSLYPIV